MRNWVGLSKTEIDTRCDTRLIPVPPTDVPPVCGDGRLRAQSSRFKSASRALDLANFMIHPSSIFVEGIKMRTPKKIDSQTIKFNAQMSRKLL